MTVSLPPIPETRTWIGGAPEAPAGPGAGPVVDPNTGAVLAEGTTSSPAQLEAAIAAAHAAHVRGDWLALGVEGRAAIMERFADELDALAEPIAVLDAVNSGVPVSLTRLFGGSNGGAVRAAIGHFRALGDARAVPADDRDVKVHWIPWGPTALITPWNAPSAMVVKKLAYTLMAGSPAIVKPSPASPFSAQLVMEALVRAGAPAGLVSLVEGGADIGSALVADPRVRAVSMTGSTPTGRAIAAAAAPNFTRLHLELGSNNPAIVRADADIELTADSLVSGFLKLSGQWCEAPRRVYVARERAAELEAALVARLMSVRVGSSLDEASEVGPVAYEGRRTELLAQRDALAAAGGRVVTVHEIPEEGWFIAPTLVIDADVEPGVEVFGPILTITSVGSDAEALARANSGQVGLAGYVYSADGAAARALGVRLDAGEVKVNSSSVLDMSPESEQAFFGASGLGGHGDAGLARFAVGARIVGEDPAGLPL
ncbi:aldehyde dehydrogenase [Salinibacterium sp. ZJ70]|uniref:aldehyde dehydrogenase family protein n=1 Tax=Salinibacterium sp. ZJ70 TaxID=2708084 RepID=UPI001424060F|nr:aldehyde dehydrogenase family protein [Salinibacterium sp. ZJ70]